MNILLYLGAGSLAADIIYGFYMVGRPRETVTLGKAFALLVFNGLFIALLVASALRLT